MSSHIQIFQAIIKHCRVTAAIVNNSKNFFSVWKKRGLRLAFAGIQPVNITLNRSDFPVVDDIPVRMRPRPAGKGIGAEAGVYRGHRCCEIKIRTIQIKMAELDGGQQTLVDDCAGRQAGNGDVGAVFRTGR